MSITIRSLAIPDIKLLAPKRHGDARGFFVETWNRQTLAAVGITADFCQDNYSFSALQGTIRGLHFQKPPFAQAKLVSVLAGSVFDVVVDLRRASPTFGRSVTIELSAEEGTQVFIPAGFAHGFCTLAPDTAVSYKVDAHYAPSVDAGVFWADPDLGIPWPIASERALLSPKDAKLPRWKEIESPF